MTTATLNSHPMRNRQRGVALVMVLLLVALLSMLVVSFFLDVRTESISSSNYSERSKVKMLSDSVQNLVMGQIQKATEGISTSGRNLAWASQPGMIRTWNEDGTPVSAYKLYSAEEMIVAGGFRDSSDISADVPTDWQSRPAEFTDLNSPVLTEDPDGPIHLDDQRYAARFPIISGNDLEPGSYGDTSVKTYKAKVEGFGVAGQPDIPQAAIRPNLNPIPMPVRWLYILEDGTITTFNSGSVLGASKDNPIVGRVAFWTDDDTCKLNINTAAEGVHWDRPYTSGLTERLQGNNIPAQNEFATFPGHPATTCLSTVLGSVFPVPDWVSSSSDYDRYLAPYYDLTPRVTQGGSKGGTQRIASSSGIINYDADRLYPTVDEFMFRAKTSTSEERSQNHDALITNKFLEQSRFFLTAHNRAPEVNLFNRPRISLWPLDPLIQNAKDKLIAYCSTVNEKPFYFQRSVVQIGTPAPTAEKFLNTSQSTTVDWDKYPRNKVLYNYLQALTSSANRIPGLGGSLGLKYPGNLRNQILTEMVDYIRSCINISSTEMTPNYTFAPPKGVKGQGQVLPLVLAEDGKGGTRTTKATRGFGRFMTISEGSLILYNTNQPTTASPSIITQENQARAVFAVEPFCPSPGIPAWSPNVRIRATNLDQFRLGTRSLSMPSPATNICSAFESEYTGTRANSVDHRRSTGCTPFPATKLMFYYMDGNTRRPKQVGSSSSSDASYPFASTSDAPLGIPINVLGDRFLPLHGANVKLDILGPENPSDPNANEPIQTLTLNFGNTQYKPEEGTPNEPVQIPIPEPLPLSDHINLFPANQPTPSPAYFNFNNRIPAVATDPEVGMKASLICGEVFNASRLLNQDIRPNALFNQRGDVVRSMEASRLAPLYGDLRALSLVFDTDRASPAAPLFIRHPFYRASDPSTASPEFTAGTAFDFYASSSNDATRKHNYRFAEGLRSDDWIFFGQFGLYYYGGNRQIVNLRSASNSQNMVGRKATLFTGGALITLPSRNHVIDRDSIPAVPFGLNGAFLDANSGLYGDWDTGLGVGSDGPFINMADQGNSSLRSTTVNAAGGMTELTGGYYSRGYEGIDTAVNASATFSPNRQVASAVTFGSLPTGVDPLNPSAIQPWKTLLFCANPAAGLNHPGFGRPVTGSNPYPPYENNTPPDHAFLDLFTMPIVEGYPISEPMSTAGKVNMNYQIAPFTYIHRSTAVRGVLKSVRVSALPTYTSVTLNTETVTNYKGGGDWKTQMRYPLNLDESTGTLRQFEQRFEKGDLFRSATEICDMFLVPRQATNPPASQSYPAVTDPKFPSSSGEIDFSDNDVARWWSGSRQTDARGKLYTGDNLRETPYGAIYPRLTTKSNSYTIHVRVQALKKSALSIGLDTANCVSGEYRGSFQIERYLDPNEIAGSKVDFAELPLTDPNGNVGKYYKFRTITTKEFKP